MNHAYSLQLRGLLDRGIIEPFAQVVINDAIQRMKSCAGCGDSDYIHVYDNQRSVLDEMLTVIEREPDHTFAHPMLDLMRAWTASALIGLARSWEMSPQAAMAKVLDFNLERPQVWFGAITVWKEWDPEYAVALMLQSELAQFYGSVATIEPIPGFDKIPPGASCVTDTLLTRMVVAGFCGLQALDTARVELKQRRRFTHHTAKTLVTNDPTCQMGVLVPSQVDEHERHEVLPGVYGKSLGQLPATGMSVILCQAADVLRYCEIDMEDPKTIPVAFETVAGVAEQVHGDGPSMFDGSEGWKNG